MEIDVFVFVFVFIEHNYHRLGPTYRCIRQLKQVRALMELTWI